MYRYKTVIDRESLNEVMPLIFRQTRNRIVGLVISELVVGVGMAFYVSRNSYTPLATFGIYTAMSVAIALVILLTARKKYKAAVERSIQQNLEKIEQQYHTSSSVKFWQIKDGQAIPEANGETAMALEELVSVVETEHFLLASFQGSRVQIIDKSSIEGCSAQEFAANLRNL